MPNFIICQSILNGFFIIFYVVFLCFRIVFLHCVFGDRKRSVSGGNFLIKKGKEKTIPQAEIRQLPLHKGALKCGLQKKALRQRRKALRLS